MTSTGLHEAVERLSPATLDAHRAIVVADGGARGGRLVRAARPQAATDGELRAVLEHNRDEEKEHASMLLEWLRRHDEVLDRHLRTYLWSEGSITAVEAEAEATGDCARRTVISASGGLRGGSAR